MLGGEGGIRTPGACEGSTDFKSAAFDHSATSPIVAILTVNDGFHKACLQALMPTG